MKHSKFKYYILLFLMIILLPFKVMAKNINLDIDKYDLTIGDEITVSVSLDDEIKAYAVMATFTYDENVFTKIDVADFTDLNQNMSISYNDNSKKFGLINETGKLDNELFKVHLKVKDDANVGDTNIALTNIVVSDGKNSETLAKTIKTVLVTRDAKPGEEIPTNKPNKVEDTENEELKVFTSQPFMITLGISAIIVLALVIYIALFKKDKKKLKNILVGIATILIISFVILYIANINKRDVNNDGVKDYNDAKEILEYLLDITGKEEKDNNKNTSNKTNGNKKPNIKPDNKYDVNNDGKVDINDAGNSTENTTEHTKVTISEVKQDIYVKKGDITLKFNADINPKSVTITKVKINDKYYNVINNNGEYAAVVNSNEAGKCEFVITSVILSNGKEVNAKLKFTKEVLKDTPYVNKFNLNDEKGSLSFELVDTEDAFLNGEATIYDGETVIAKEEVKSTTKINDIPVDEDKVYLLEVVGEYDLDSNKNDDNNHFTNQTMFNHSFVIGGDYNFTLTDLGITDAIKKDEKPVISFTSTNTKGVTVENASLTIGNKTNNYVISKIDGNNYEIILEDADMSVGKHKVNLDSVRLKSLKTFNNKEDYDANTLTYTVLKDAPKVTNLSVQEDSENKSIVAKFSIKDENNAISSLKVVLVDSTGAVISSQSLEEYAQNNEVSLSYDGSTDGNYKVEILADYALSDQYNYTDKLVGEESITINTGVYIEAIEYVETKQNNQVIDSGRFASKGQKFYRMSFIVHTKGVRTYTRLSAITINGLNYIANGGASAVANAEGEYRYTSTVAITVPKEAGITEVTANRVQLEINAYYNKVNDFYHVPSVTKEYEVLKDIPSITNLKVKEENYKEKEVTFTFDVVDKEDAFISGKLELNGKSKEITKGSNTVTFKGIETDKVHDLIFKADYKLSTGEIEDPIKQTEKTSAEIYKVKYGLYEENLYNDIYISEGIPVSEKNNKYFQKNEDIKLNLTIAGIPEYLGVYPERAIINDREYDLKALMTCHEVTLNGYTTSGERELKVSAIILNNGKVITFDKPYEIKVEVLKDIPKITDYKYAINDDSIKITLDKKDSDNAIDGDLLVNITDDTGKELYNDKYQDIIEFKKNKDAVRYYIKVTGSYDRDIDKKDGSENYQKNANYLDETISLDKNNIELKDITYITLFKEENDKVLEIREITKEEIDENIEKYFVEVNMENMPSIYAKIKKVTTEDNHLMLILDYDYVTKEGSKSKEIKVDFGSLVDGTFKNETNPLNEFNILKEKIKNNEDIVLTHDYDFKDIEVTTSYYFENFSGSIDGNNHKITNLSKQLFKEISNVEIKNLVIENANISGAVRGILADKATSTTLYNVHLYNGNIKANETINGTGIMFGETRTNLDIQNSSIVNSSVSGGKRTGGFVGWAYDKVIIKNSYINDSSVTGNNDAIGGIFGEVSNPNVLMSNLYSKVTMNGGAGNAKAGFLGWSNNTGATKLADSLSLSQGNSGTRVHGNGISATNVYELAESTMKSQAGGQIKEISSNDINKEFFIDSLHWDENIWNLDNASADVPPILKGEKFEIKKSPIETEDGYDSNKRVLYNNLMKLMPFYDSEKIVRTGMHITDDNLLNKEIEHIVPIDSKGNIVTYLTSDNLKKISKIKVVYKTKEKVTYNVKFDNTYDMVASYRIPDLNIDYTYNHYIIDANSQVVNNLTNYLKSLSYTDNLDTLTATKDSRILRDFYNDVTSKELKEFTLKYLSNSNYTNTTNDDVINSHLESEIKKDKKIEKVLYMYNYFRRFYDVEIDGMKLYDFMLFNMNGFDESLTSLAIARIYLNDGNNFNTGSTGTKYRDLLSGYTKLNTIAKFIEYMVTEFSDDNMNDWVRNEFEGYLVEIPVKGHETEIQYTLWDHFSNEDANYNNPHRAYDMMLPILTLPKNAAYIISTPVQFIIGAQRSYIEDPEDATSQSIFQRRVQSYAKRMATYFDIAYKILGDAKYFNDIHTFQLDKRFAYDENGAMVYQQAYVTEEPFHKNFNEVTGRWQTSDGNAAVAWGDRIDWSAEGLMDGNIDPDLVSVLNKEIQEYTYHTFTHETAHNIDARLFLKNNGRRFDAGGEDYADSNLMQSFGPNDIVMNLSTYREGEKIASNYTPDRINSPEKIQSYYDKVFQTIYVMDYIEAEAFLQLPKDVQANLAVQVSYPNENLQFETLEDGKTLTGVTYKEDPYAIFRARQTSRFTQLSEIPDVFNQMKLTSINDLIDNHIMIYPGIYKVGSRGSNSYGGEGIGHVHWYQPWNPEGRPDSYAIKWIAYEMLGLKGYDDGYIEYYSNINSIPRQIYTDLSKPSKGKTTVNYKTDAMALKKITDQFDNFDEYKKYRFAETKKKLERLNSAVNVKAYVQKLYDALIEDSKYSKTRLESLLKAYNTDEKGCLSNYWCTRGISGEVRGFLKSTAVRQDIYYTLKDLTNDFEGEIFASTTQQDVSNLTVNKGE